LRIYRGIAPLGNRVAFGSDDAVAGDEPWVTDGTALGTRLLIDIAAGTAGSRPSWFTLFPDLAAGPSVLFSADDGSRGTEPWIVPAAVLGLAALRDVRPACAAAGPPARLQTAGGSPSLGNASFALRVRSAHANAPVALALSTQHGASLLGCASALPAVVVLSSVTDAAGGSTFALPVPGDAAMIGSRVYAQPLIAVLGGRLLDLVELGAVSVLIIGAP
jgi:ELWxxDGT repeat protein